MDLEPVGVPLPRASRHRSRRLRKKLALGEFQLRGFRVTYQVDRSVAFDAADRLMDRFIEEAIEGNGLSCGGGGDLYDMGFYVLANAGRRHESVLPEQRQAVLDWLAAEASSGVVNPEASALADANYDPPSGP